MCAPLFYFGAREISAVRSKELLGNQGARDLKKNFFKKVKSFICSALFFWEKGGGGGGGEVSKNEIA